MKKSVVIFVVMLFLVLVGGASNLFAQEERPNEVGLRYTHLLFNDSGQFDNGSGFELFGIIDSNRNQSDGFRLCFEGFAGSYSASADADTLSEGDLDIRSFGAGLLLKGKSTYWGFGLLSYQNDFDLGNSVINTLWDLMDEVLWATYGELLLSMTYDETVDNATGFYLKAGTAIALSPQANLTLDLKKTFIEADVEGELWMETWDPFFDLDYDYLIIAEDDVDLGSFSIDIGVSIRF